MRTESFKELPAGTGVLLTTAAFVVVVAGMKAAEAILVPFLVAAFLALICGPPMFWLQRKGVPSAVALLIVVAVIPARAVVSRSVSARWWGVRSTISQQLCRPIRCAYKSASRRLSFGWTSLELRFPPTS